MMLIKKKLRLLISRYFQEPSLKEIPPAYVKSNNLKRVVSISESQKFFLFQGTENYYYAFLFMIISQQLVNLSGSNISSKFYLNRSLRPSLYRSLLSIPKAVIYSNTITDKVWTKLYSASIGDIAFKFSIPSTPCKFFSRLHRAFTIWKSLDGKKSLLSLRVDGVLVGDLIYDSYLRFKPSATVAVDHWYLLIVIYQCLKNLEVCHKEFSKNNISCLFTSYTSYLDHGVAVRVALEHDIRTYSFGSFSKLYKKHFRGEFTHTSRHQHYLKDFNEMSEPDRHAALSKAEHGLSGRLNGQKDSATFYMRNSAYKKTESKCPDVSGSVVIFLHDFFDSPHVYDWMLFADFYEWITKTLDFAINNEIPIAVKPHPNQIIESEEIVEKLKVKYKEITFLSAGITNRQLVDQGIACGVTVYGTVIHELNYMGIPCIACADHPSIAFDDSLTARTMSTYYKLLSDYKSLPFDQDKARYNSLAFYYSHNLKLNTEEHLLQEILLKYWGKINDCEPRELLSLFHAFKTELTKNSAFNNSMLEILAES